MTTIVRLRRGAPWSRTTPPCGFPTAASANAVAFRHAAAGWTAATRARPVPRSGAGASGACEPIGAAGPSGGATPRPSDGRRGARTRDTCSVPGHEGAPRDPSPPGPGPGHQQGAGASERAADVVGGPSPDQQVERRVPRPRHAEAPAERGSTTTSCFPVQGALATRRAGQHPWPAALLPFSDAERH
jgi:hypothetical protein